MSTSIFDDGSLLTFDELGNVIAQVDSSGAGVAVPPPGGTAIVQQFRNLFDYGVRAAIDSHLRPAVPAAGAPALLPTKQAQMQTLMLLGAAALAAYLLLAR